MRRLSLLLCCGFWAWIFFTFTGCGECQRIEYLMPDGKSCRTKEAREYQLEFRDCENGWRYINPPKYAEYTRGCK